MSDGNGAQQIGPPPGAHLYSRDGFVGKMCVAIRPHTIYEYTSVEGPHAPKRVLLEDVQTPDSEDPAALPTPIAVSRHEVVISVSGRREETPYVFRNTECDELHFVQRGEMEYVTDFGTLRAGPGDFIALGRTVSYRVRPTSESTLRVIFETPEVIELRPPAPFGMVNFARDVSRPSVEPIEDGETEIWLKCFDGVTKFVAPHNPLSCLAIVDGQSPVWKLNLTAIAPLAYPSAGGPPQQFAQTPTTDLMVYTLSARPPGGRPPQHHNADFEEVVFYFKGPRAYGEVTQPGTMIWVPKGVTHWGPTEDVEVGSYFAWLVESRGTLRLTDAGLAASQPMETGQLGVQAAAPVGG